MTRDREDDEGLREFLAGRVKLVRKVLQADQVGLVVQASLARRVNLGTLALMVHKEPRVCLEGLRLEVKASQETKDLLVTQDRMGCPVLMDRQARQETRV